MGLFKNEMKFEAKLPSEMGYYWYKAMESYEPEIVQICTNPRNSGLTLLTFGEKNGKPLTTSTGLFGDKVSFS